MRKLIAATLLATTLAVGCSTTTSSEVPDNANTPTTSEVPDNASTPTFDRDAALRESWEMARDTFPANLKLEICDAAKHGGEAEVRAYLTSEEMPFEIPNPDYDAKQWVAYCGSSK